MGTDIVVTLHSVQNSSLMTLRSILVPTDFSTSADRALAYAVNLADRFGASLQLLHVVDELDSERYGIEEGKEQAVSLRDQIRTEALERLRKIAPDESPVEVQPNVSLHLGGDVADAIREHVEDRDVDLVAMGTHGRQGIDRLVLGSVTDSLIRRVKCPVLTVRDDGGRIPDAQEVSFADILSPIDFSEHSHEALRMSKAIANRYHTPLHLLFVAEKRVVPTFSDTGIPGVGVVEMDPEIVENARQALEQLEQEIGGPTVDAKYHVRKGNVARHIVDFAETEDIGLVVMATRGYTGMTRFLMGSNTERVVRAASCPVLTIPFTGEEDVSSDSNSE